MILERQCKVSEGYGYLTTVLTKCSIQLYLVLIWLAPCFSRVSLCQPKVNVFQGMCLDHFLC